MRRSISTICAAAMAVTSFVGFAGVSEAAPVRVQTAQPETNLIQVRDYHRRHHRHHRFERRGRYYYYNGHRGSHRYHHGWRHYNGWWFPPAAFIGGAIIGGALASQPHYSGSNAHIRWCYNHYRSYRASDNTYQPYNGPRRQCYSPYS